tara:strand:+ start:1517 stop:1912 length:396 start_codon:yes stop_codon:yes gene_type:complete
MTSVNNIELKEMTSVSNKESPTTVDDIVKIGKKVINTFPNGVSLKNITEVTMSVLKEITILYYLKPSQKKEMIVDILIYIVDNTHAGDLESLDPVIKQVIPGIIDALIVVENGALVVDKPKSILKKCLPCF